MPMALFSNLVKIVKNNHRHPANKALHVIGFPLYIVGLGFIAGYVTGFETDPTMGMCLWLAAISMFIIGHKIEGNLGNITPVLILRFYRIQLKRVLYAVQN